MLTSILSLDPIGGNEDEIIRVMYYSSFHYGKALEFSRNNNSTSLTKHCKNIENYPDTCTAKNFVIPTYHWEEVKKLLTEYEFYTEEKFQVAEDVLDGYIYIIEAKIKSSVDDKVIHRVLGRVSTDNNKILKLCESLFEYERKLY